MEYGFKIVARIKNNLSEEDKAYVENRIEHFKNLLDITKINDETYIRPRKNNRDLGSACLFYVQLKKEKNFFGRLEYYDYINDEMEIAV